MRWSGYLENGFKAVNLLSGEGIVHVDEEMELKVSRVLYNVLTNHYGLSQSGEVWNVR